MNLPDPVIVRGATGRDHHFWPHPLGTEFDPGQSGIYIFAHPWGDHWWPHYVGQAKDLNNRVGRGVWGHEKIAAASQLGASHVLVSVFTVGALGLSAIEHDIIQALSPQLNQIAPPGFGFRGA